MENSVMLNAVCHKPVSLKVVQEPFYRKGFSPFVNKQTGTWWEYDDDKKGFFDTGIIAQGRDGDTVDVQIDGESIVQDGVANIPKATDKTNGVIKVGYGLQVMSDGSVRTASASDLQLRNRTEAFGIISPYNFDRMLKYGMCDGKGAEWTAKEQAAARERMGCYNGYTVLMDTVIEKEASLIYFTLPNNTVEFIAYFELYNTAVSCEGSSYLMFANKGDVYPNAKIYSYFGGELKIGDINIKAIQKCVIINDEDVFVEYAALSTNEEKTSQNKTRNGRVGIAKRTSNKIAFHFTGQTFPIGTRFLVLVRCK